MAIVDAATVTIVHYLDRLNYGPAGLGTVEWKEDLSFLTFKPDVCIVRQVSTNGSNNVDNASAFWIVQSDLVSNRDQILCTAVPYRSCAPQTQHFSPNISASNSFHAWNGWIGYDDTGHLYTYTSIAITLEFLRYG